MFCNAIASARIGGIKFDKKAEAQVCFSGQHCPFHNREDL